MNKKLIIATITILVWGISSFLMSILYYWLKEKGMIWDNPEFILDPNSHTYYHDEASWNGRKIIFAVMGISMFFLMVTKVVTIFMEDES